MHQNSISEQRGSLDNLSYLTSEESIFQTTSKQADGKDKNFFDIFGIVSENDMNSGLVISIGKVVIVAFMLTYLMLYYSVCQALFMLLMITVKQTGNEFRKRLKLEGYRDDENANIGLYKVSKVHELKD